MIMLLCGLVLCSLAGLDTAVREHWAGYRSHSTLLSGMLAVLAGAVVGDRDPAADRSARRRCDRVRVRLRVLPQPIRETRGRRLASMSLIRLGAQALALLAVLVFGSVVLWVAVPIGWLWVGSQVQAETDNLGIAMLTMAFGVLVSLVALIPLLGRSPGSTSAPAWRAGSRTPAPSRSR